MEQAHEIHTLAKDLKNCSKESPCVLPDKFVAGGIISKLPPSQRDFDTSLKHKRQEFTIDRLIGTLDVEEKAKTKDICGKGVIGASSANLVQKNNSHKNKKRPPLNQPKTKQTTTFKKKKKGACYVCASSEHFAAKCPNRKGKDYANVVISKPRGTSGYSNLLPTVLSVFFHPSGGLTLVLIFMFVLMLFCFLLTRSEGLPIC